jgi:cytochrome c peroxidase
VQPGDSQCGRAVKGHFDAVLVLALTATACSSPGATPCDLPNVPAEQCADAHAILLPASLPPARGNRFGDDDGAARLGFLLFFDSNLGTGVSCATCHAPELAFVDRLSVSKGKEVGTRNAPTIFDAARLGVFFWDGRADSLWSQPLFPLENPVEMGATRLAVAHLIATSYAPQYGAIFGALPDVSSWPAAGKPGDPAFDALSPDVADEVNRVYSNVGKALEAFMRKDVTSTSPVDSFLAGDFSAIIPAAQRGLAVFLENGCQGCHSGPALSDEQFHDVGFPSLPGAAPDPGAAAGLPVLAANVFNLAGPYADPGPGVPGQLSTTPRPEGSFRTPSLRNVALTFPYGHDGALPSLSAVLAVHAPALTSTDQGDVIAFLGALSGAYPPPPWNNWPIPQ